MRDYKAEYERERQRKAKAAMYGHEKISRRNMKKMVVPGDDVAGIDEQEPHWRCQDCGLVCFCTGLARLMPHPRCLSEP